MGILRDLFRFIMGVVFGVPYGPRIFTENLEMAENYLRWGRERGDVRDFNSALVNLRKCKDEDAPKTDMLERKYTALFDVLFGLMEAELTKYENRVAEIDEDYAEYREEIESTQRQVDNSKAHLEELQKDGAAIQAGEEEQRLHEHQTRLERLRGLIDGGERLARLNESYQELVTAFLPHQGRLEEASENVRMNMEPSDERDRLLGFARTRMTQLEQRLHALAPEESPEDAEDAAPPPASGG